MERNCDRSTAAGASLPRRQCEADGCAQRVRPGCCKYCSTHSRQASALWKRRQRKLLTLQGQKPWRDHWRSVTGSEEAARLAYNRYMRAYMRKWRARQRNNLAITDWFEERETAAKRGRPIFTKMLRLLQAAKPRSKGFNCTSVPSRNASRG